jgi:micrococcal nuclease
MSKSRHLALVGIVIAMVLSGCTLVSHAVDELGPTESTSDQSTATTAGVKVELLRVVDGDTIAVKPTEALPATNDSGTEHTVRVLGIDTPEMNKASGGQPDCGAQDATRHLKSLLGGQHDVSLVFDAVSDHTDRFGRSLAYVEIPGNELVDVGLAQVRDGYAEAWYPKSEPAPQRYQAYVAAQRAAEASGAGAHATCSNIGR